MSLVDDIIARMVEATGAKNQQEMLDIAGLATGLASNWKRRGRVPEKSIDKVAKVTGVSFQWIQTGEGMIRPKPPDHSKVCDPGWLTEEQRHLLNLWECADEISKSNALLILEQSARQSREDEGGGSNSAGRNSA